MNRTTVNVTLLSCGLANFPLNPTKISSDLSAVLMVRTAVNALTCPLIILLNILVMVAVKTKPQLRTKSNIALACLATTDLAVGLVVQPLHITSTALRFNGEKERFCEITNMSVAITMKSVFLSAIHLFLMSSERYVAIKHPFTHENQVTEVRIIIASGLAWAVVILIPLEELLTTDKHFIAVSIMVIFIFIVMAYFNVSVYMEVRRNENQIAANQVSMETKEKILKNKKAFYTTTIVLIAIFLCYVPVRFFTVVITNLKDKIPANEGHMVLSLVSLLPILNSLFNPLIYAVRLRSFRVAFIQLLSRKAFAQAEELERKIFGPRQIGVIANVEQGQNVAGREENEQKGNETLNNGRVTTAWSSNTATRRI